MKYCLCWFLLVVTQLCATTPSRAQSPAPDLPETNSSSASVEPVSKANASGNFLERFAHAYWDDWNDAPTDSVEPPRRGFPAPVTSPPFPFSDWPYGGSVVIGKPWTQSGPLMQALWSGPHGEGEDVCPMRFHAPPHDELRAHADLLQRCDRIFPNPAAVLPCEFRVSAGRDMFGDLIE